MTFEEWFSEEIYTVYGGTRDEIVFYCTDDRPKHMGYDQIVALLKEAWETRGK